MESLYLVLLTLGILIFFFLWKGNQQRWPPGPKGLPIFGNMFQINMDRPHLTLTNWASTFGDIYRIRLLGNNIIVLSGHANIKRALVTDSNAFAGRPYMARITEYVSKGSQMVIFYDNTEKWKRTKKTIMNAMRSYGEGLQRIEDLAIEASEGMLKEFDAHGGKPFDTKDILRGTMLKVIYNMIFGEAASEEDANKMLELETTMNSLLPPGGVGTELEVMPWLRYFRRSYTNQLENVRNEEEKMFIPKILSRKKEAKEKMECIVDALWNANESEANPDECLDEFDILVLICELMGAGTTTSSRALYAMLAQCVNKPDIQGRLQAEIDDVIGSRGPRLADRAKMPFVNACIFELLRYISHVPTAIPHKTTSDVTIDGYTIPKGTEVWMNLWAMHHDDRYWDEPWEYKPERFLTPDGQLVPPDHHNRHGLMAFGAGRRVCAGETLAKSRLFILLTTLLQNFKVLPEDKDHRPETDPRKSALGLVLSPPNYKIRLTARHT